ncbi:MAG TPA: prepilin-type N-terminal cleavage/methylation domain-containing protein [Thermoanaerobaculia bacterium]|nr:prepilin-type N-terminal cleavage/methylation domain-containing protein [Thermoanaerobaculia bacterium]
MARHGTAGELRTGARKRRGSSFVEVLLAMTIMALVLVGILQMFSVSLIVNKGSAARTQMLFKCQQVVENLRWYYYVTSRALAAPIGTGIPALATAAGAPVRVDLPYVSTDPDWAFWGPNGANVMEEPLGNGPYKISYTIEADAAQSSWVVTVSAVPTNVPGGPGDVRYLMGASGNAIGGGKRVDYVSVFPQ